MRSQRRQGDLPSPEEILATQLWNIQHLIKKHKSAVHIVVSSASDDSAVRCEVIEVFDLSASDTPSVIILVRPLDEQKDNTDTEERRQGDVQDE